MAGIAQCCFCGVKNVFSGENFVAGGDDAKFVAFMGVEDQYQVVVVCQEVVDVERLWQLLLDAHSIILGSLLPPPYHRRSKGRTAKRRWTAPAGTKFSLPLTVPNPSHPDFALPRSPFFPSPQAHGQFRQLLGHNR